MNSKSTRIWILLLALANAWIAIEFASQVRMDDPVMLLFVPAMAGLPMAILAVIVSRHRAANLVLAAGLTLATSWFGWYSQRSDPFNVNAGLGSLVVIAMQWGLLALCVVAYVVALILQRRREPER